MVPHLTAYKTVGKTTYLYNLTNTNGFFINTINGKKGTSTFSTSISCSFCVFEALHLLMVCHVLVRHLKHYNVCSLFAVNIHENGVSALMQKKSCILQFSLNPREKNLIYNWHIGGDKIMSSDNC
jgi:hypothetical protein